MADPIILRPGSSLADFTVNQRGRGGPVERVKTALVLAAATNSTPHQDCAGARSADGISGTFGNAGK